MTYTGIDFETYGSRNLPKVGLDNYVTDPQFRPLICSVAYRDYKGNVRLKTFDFVSRAYKDQHLQEFEMFMCNDSNITFSAHNAGFERAVLQRMNIHLRADRFIDSAVIARIMGADSHLENAAPQLLGVDKLEQGKNLILKFSIPRENGTALVDDPNWDSTTDPDWVLFIEYCERDALLSLLFAEKYGEELGTINEQVYEPITARMNQAGWRVDLDTVRAMLDRSEFNKDEALALFRQKYDPEGKLNLNSLKQLKEWCKARGISASSFNEEHVNKLIEKIESKIASDPDLTFDQEQNYTEVLHMLDTKRIIGGSSLKKLPVILDLVGEDGRLRNQYMHCGAGQTYRTSGTGVQMQNLKRLSTIRDVTTITDPAVEWTNEDIAANLRQCFTATNPRGELIVGDFSSVESRGLAYLAGEQWKLDAYADGKDLYKVLAGKIYGVQYEDVDKAQRQTGKVGELSCGYGAGPVAVTTFAKNMHVEMSEVEALQLVRDWRETNPKIVQLWDKLDALLHRGVRLAENEFAEEQLAHDIVVSIARIETPPALQQQHPGAKSLVVRLSHLGSQIMERVFHGCYERGRNICYYKPSGRKTGNLWSGSYIDPKTKKLRFYDIYGGKLAGILTQSFCREIFFGVLMMVEYAVVRPGVTLVGQFHDEIVLDFDPDVSTALIGDVLLRLEREMSNPGRFDGFPLSAEVKHAYRYIK